jgi:hypothetical protein
MVVDCMGSAIGIAVTNALGEQIWTRLPAPLAPIDKYWLPSGEYDVLGWSWPVFHVFQPVEQAAAGSGHADCSGWTLFERPLKEAKKRKVLGESIGLNWISR